MSKFVKALEKSQLPAGSAKTVVLSGTRVLITNVGGEFYAVGDTCTHAGCSLGNGGKLEGSVITCPCHSGQFDVTTGAVITAPPKKPVRAYTVKMVGDSVMVEV